MTNDMLCTAAHVLVECGYAMESTVTDVDGTEYANVLIENDNSNIWIKVEPFEDTLIGRQQLEALIGHYMVSTIVDVEFDGWWVECFTPGRCTMKKQDVKANHVLVRYPVKYEGKYRREAEIKCMRFCLGRKQK